VPILVHCYNKAVVLVILLFLLGNILFFLFNSRFGRFFFFVRIFTEVEEVLTLFRLLNISFFFSKRKHRLLLCQRLYLLQYGAIQGFLTCRSLQYDDSFLVFIQVDIEFSGHVLNYLSCLSTVSQFQNAFNGQQLHCLDLVFALFAALAQLEDGVDKLLQTSRVCRLFKVCLSRLCLSGDNE